MFISMFIQTLVVILVCCGVGQVLHTLLTKGGSKKEER
jgi:hypothetical protein